MDDLLSHFKAARRTQRAVEERINAERAADGDRWDYLRSPHWDDYTAATLAFGEASKRFADYLLGVEGER